MKASILFYKPFIIPVWTKLTLQCGKTSETVFFAGYKINCGLIIDKYDLLPKFRKATKQGKPSNYNANRFPVISFDSARNIELQLEPKDLVNVIRTYVEEEFDCCCKEVRRIVKNISPLKWMEGGVEYSIESVHLILPKQESDAPVIVAAEVKYRCEDGITYSKEKPIESLPTFVQESILLRLYDAAEGDKQHRCEAVKLIYDI